MSINFVDLEEKVFLDKKVRRLFPHFNQLFAQYDLSRVNPILKQLGKRAIHEFIEQLKSSDKTLLKEILGDEIIVLKLDSRISYNIESDIESIEKTLNDQPSMDNLSISRIGDRVFLTSWK